MNEIKQELILWTVAHAKNKDIMRKEIRNYKIKDDIIKFELKNKNEKYLIYPELNDEIIAKISNEDHTIIVCLNKRNNLDFLIKEWHLFSEYKKLSIIFCNHIKNQRWIIFPYTHNKITEKSSLKPGLLSLFSNIEELT